MKSIYITCIFIIFLSILVLHTPTHHSTVVENLEVDRPLHNSWVHTECISLENCRQRRRDLIQHMKTIDFRPRHFKFSKATTPRNMEDEYRPYAKFIKNTRLGCWLSHLNVWKKYRHHTAPVLVLEDDVRFEPDFATKLNKIAKALDTVDWDLCMLGWRDRPGIDPARENIPLGVCDLEIIQNNFDQMHCYLINPLHLDKLLQLFDPVNMDVENIFYEFTHRDLALAIDTHLPNLLKLGHITVLGVKNQLADQISSYVYDSTTN